MDRWASFDCYGTLIDWNGGIRAELARVFGDDRADELLARYHELEPELQRDGDAELPRGADRGDAPRSAPPRARSTACRVAARRGARSRRCAARSRRLRRRGWKLAILSNTDDDFIAASQVQIGVPFDEVVVAQEIGSYKPAHRHWEEFFARTRAPREGHVHVGASLFHDVAPANELGLRSIWINRLGETADTPQPTRELRRSRSGCRRRSMSSFRLRRVRRSLERGMRTSTRSPRSSRPRFGDARRTDARARFASGFATRRSSPRTLRGARRGRRRRRPAGRHLGRQRRRRSTSTPRATPAAARASSTGARGRGCAAAEPSASATFVLRRRARAEQLVAARGYETVRALLSRWRSTLARAAVPSALARAASSSDPFRRR